MYDLVLVEPGPLPPHERTWRHPSELGPTRVDVDPGQSRRTVVTAFATGTLAVMLVGVLVIAVTPSAPAGPVTLSATTSPGLVTTSAIATSSTSPSAARATPPRQAIGVARQPIGLVSFSAMPNAVAAAPPLTLDGRAVADRLPDDADPVYLHTEAVTYRLDWHAVEELTTFAAVPDGSVVFDEEGDVVAHVRRGDLVTIVGD